MDGISSKGSSGGAALRKVMSLSGTIISGNFGKLHYCYGGIVGF
jgi:hypothetical protein